MNTEVNTNKITITTSAGTATIDAKLFKGYNEEAMQLLQEIEVLMDNFKSVVEAVADATNLKKGSISKFYKTKFADKLAAQSETSELFEQLDDILN